MSEPPPSSTLRERLLGLLVLLTVVALGAAARIETALTHDKFDVERPEGMLQSDPGLLYYLTDRVVQAGGGLPDDFRADPRIEHPETVDIPARFTVGLEFLVAWARWIVGEGVPLHVLCVWVAGIVASLAAVGVYGLAFELTRSPRWAGLAAVVYAILPASYRTIGFVLVREDLSLPLLALHLWLVARAVRVCTAASALTAGVALGLALATWHATVFLATLEGLAVMIWFLWSDRNPFDDRRGVAFLAGAALPCLLVPALWAKGAVLAPPMQLAGGLALASALGGRSPRRRRAIAVGGAAVLGGASLALAFALGTAGDFGHVLAVLGAKTSHLGVRPADPALLSFEARMMWQGPFATLQLGGAFTLFGIALLAIPVLLVLEHLRFLRRTGADREQVLYLFLLAACFGAWVMVRTAVLVALLLPVALVVTVQRVGGERRSVITALGVGSLVFLQLVAFGSWLAGHSLPWHSPARREALRAIVSAVESHVPEEAAVAADFMTSTAILAHTGRPIVLQPKWETSASRERVRAFWAAFYGGAPEELRRLLREEWRCEYLALDRHTLWWLEDSRYLAGLDPRQRDPRPGTAAAALLAGADAGGFAPVPGYELLWSGPQARGPDGASGDVYRLFRLAP